MIEIGRVCIKIAGRDAIQKCIIIDMIDDKYVLVDGQTRRRKVNMAHLEPTKDKVEIAKGASHEEVVAQLKNIGIWVIEKKAKKEAKEKPIKKRTMKQEKKTTKKK